MPIILPEIIRLSDHGGNFTAYEGALHEEYLSIINGAGIFINGKRVKPIVDPLQHKKRHFSFAHMTSKGKVEDERELDLRRCERIVWVREILINHRDEEVRMWRQIGRGKNRIAVWHPASEFMVILEERNDSFRLVTTFLVSAPKYKVQYEKDYQTYIRALSKGEVNPI